MTGDGPSEEIDSGTPQLNEYGGPDIHDMMSVYGPVSGSEDHWRDHQRRLP